MWGGKSKMNSKKKLHCSMRKRKENEQWEQVYTAMWGKGRKLNSENRFTLQCEKKEGKWTVSKSYTAVWEKGRKMNSKKLLCSVRKRKENEQWEQCPPPILCSLFTVTLCCVQNTTELTSALKMAHNDKDSNHLQQLSPGMQVNTRYINSTKNTSWFFFKEATFLLVIMGTCVWNHW